MAIIYMESNYNIPYSIGRQLNLATSASNALVSKLLEPHDLSLAQWAVLSSLWQNGELSVKSLAEITGNAPPATSRIVDRMLSGGFVERSQNRHDRRAVTVGLSQKGEDLRHLQSIYEEVNAILLEPLSPEESENFFKLLNSVEQAGRTWLVQSKARDD